MLEVDAELDTQARRCTATRIEPGPADNGVFKLRGLVTAFDPAAGTLVIGGQTINLAGILIGVRVEAKGRTRDGTLTARSVSIDGDDHGGAEPFEISGTVSAGTLDLAARTFVVRGFKVRWSDTTDFKSKTAADLREGRKVEVKGTLSSDGTQLEAGSIEIGD